MGFRVQGYLLVSEDVGSEWYSRVMQHQPEDFKVLGVGFRIQGLGFRVQDLGLKA